jgi:Fur family peroxide stress response transcriptional regulator
MAILGEMVQEGQHLSVEEIYRRVREDFPSISLATVYKTVALMKELGEVHELGFLDDRSYYDGSRPYPHPHLVCRECGKIVDVEIPELERVVKQHASGDTEGWEVSQRFDVWGICPQCRERA